MSRLPERRWLKESVALVRAGLTWTEALTLDSLYRAAILEEYSAQEEAAWAAAKGHD